MSDYYFEVKVDIGDYRKPSGNLRLERVIRIYLHERKSMERLAKQIVYVEQTVRGTMIRMPFGETLLRPKGALEMARTLKYASKIAERNAPIWSAYVAKTLEERGAFQKGKKKPRIGNKVYTTMGVTCA